jgi:hypothetical protein
MLNSFRQSICLLRRSLPYSCAITFVKDPLAPYDAWQRANNINACIVRKQRVQAEIILRITSYPLYHPSPRIHVQIQIIFNSSRYLYNNLETSHGSSISAFGYLLM